jgi:hypothetical protein
MKTLDNRRLIWEDKLSTRKLKELLVEKPLRLIRVIGLAAINLLILTRQEILPMLSLALSDP